MRYLKIFFLHFQQISEHRARSFVWFLLSLFSPLILLLFWHGVFKSPNTPKEFNLSELTSYYLLLVIAGASLIAHVEDSVANLDIQEGGLVKYLLRPFSYFWFKFFEEIHYRILQGFYGVLVLLFVNWHYGKVISFPTDFEHIALIVMMVVLAFFLSFTYKMVLSFTAFWTTDIAGLYEGADVILLIFAGFILPLHLLPAAFQQVAYFLPFAYMVYFPVIAFQGLLQVQEIYRIIAVQATWLVFFLLLYQLMWSKGLRRFTAIGQ